MESQRTTLLKYRGLLENTESAKKLISTRKTNKKTGTGVTNIPSAVHEISFYSSVDDLCNRLALLCASKNAGNNGLNNNINSILDELLRVNAVDKSEYNHLALQPLLPLLQNIQRAQIAALGQPGQQALAMAMSPSQYATPQMSLTGHASGQDSTSHIPVPVSSRRDIIRVNTDEHLDKQDIDNLNDMKLPLPSKVYETNSLAETLKSVKSHNKSLGQYLGIGPASKGISKGYKKFWNHNARRCSNIGDF